MSAHATGLVKMHGLVFDVAGISAQGPRTENQDAFSVDAFAGSGLVAVADGMGGERAGRMAADTALQAITGRGPIHSLDAARYAVRAADERSPAPRRRRRTTARGWGAPSPSRRSRATVATGWGGCAPTRATCA
jgi:hypothetical protein